MRASRLLCRQRGLSLIELMLATVVGLMVIAIGTQLLLLTLAGSSANLRAIRFNEDLRGILNTISHDLARAGAWARAADLADAALRSDLVASGSSGVITLGSVGAGTTAASAAFAEPFTAAALDGRMLVVLLREGAALRRLDLPVRRLDGSRLQATVPVGQTLGSMRLDAGSWTLLNPFDAFELADRDGDGSFDCLRFSYDLDLDGVLGSGEHFGYRHDAAHQSIDTRSTAGTCASSSGWEDLSDPQAIEITRFAITPLTAVRSLAPFTVELRQYRIEIDARLRRDRSVQRRLQTVVRVRNPALR